MPRFTWMRGLAVHHEELNRRTAGQWHRFAPHRERIASLLRATERGGRLCVLGGGNANDLDLTELAVQFDEIHLVDVDSAAVARARARLDPNTRARVIASAPVDASGVFVELEAWQRRAPTRDELRALPEAAVERVLDALPFESDVVLSAGLWSQLLVTCELALGRGHPAKGRVAAATQLAHLAAVARLTRPGGAAVLVTDAVSSAWFPLTSANLSPLECLVAMNDARARARLIPGTDPAYLRMLLEDDPLIAPLVRAPTFHAPWPWAIDEGLRTIAYGVTFERVGAPHT